MPMSRLSKPRSTGLSRDEINIIDESLREKKLNPEVAEELDLDDHVRSSTDIL
jgi:hypothetical protein